MIDLINQLIAINLQLFHSAEHNQLQLKDFRDCEGRQISGAKLLADIMLNKELIQPSATEKNTYQLTEFGNNISLFGGWEKHLENESKLQAVLQKETIQIMQEEPKKIPTAFLSAAIVLITLIILCML
ncbi:MAG: hypothetical protein C0525_03180 [Flavobacterium sp.]|uniref:hypothetical protein n=1 Tax=Flavobacterium sp. TaxID=239 RepID=UPI0025C363DD|nr:hypothetical protein [Flavobacterium sp.]MBA4133708.1 hypothetical protein [Flavobacterium sp.]